MRKKVAVALILLGLIVGAVGSFLLPGGHGRFAYLIEIVDPRPAIESEASDGLAEMGAIRVVVLENPDGAAKPESVLLMPDLGRRLKNSDCAMGGLPGKTEWSGLAGFSSGIEQGSAMLAGHRVSVCAILQSLGPVFDESLVMQDAPAVQEALEEAGWRDHARYLILARTWAERSAVLSKLEANPGLLPMPQSSIVSPARKPLLSQSGRIALSSALIFGGLFLMGWQLRGLSRGGISRGFGRQ
jgi:hypothetical protein